MKRRDEILVGATVLITLALIIAGALWLSATHLGGDGRRHTARFRTVGGLGVGNPVVLRGVRVGRVEAIRLARDSWVEADLTIYGDPVLPQKPAILAASASLFGEWQAGIIDLAQGVDDPSLKRDLEAANRGGAVWPGATLPDIGQLTAQAGRIASDIANVSSRIGSAFDSQMVSRLRQSVSDFGRVADQLSHFTQEQTNILSGVGTNLQRGSDVLATAATSLQNSLGRIDSATNQGQLRVILDNTQAASQSVSAAAQDFRDVAGTLKANQQSLINILQSADTIMTRIRDKQGSLGLVIGDSTLYIETTRTITQLRALLTDIQANPRKYFKFSVF
ncbi:MAG TPA: MlaD family protein [Gemmatimonadales bacterium]|jgi:phospholipid/cholesterol/gamma-HCH transport system substrate-binding protein